MILEIEKYGWAKIYIGENGSIFIGDASYLSDVPLDFLEAFKLYVDNGKIPVIKCDEEGSEFIIVVDDITTYIISEREKTECFSWEISCENFIRQIITDIELQLDGVADFMCEEDGKEERKEKIISLVSYIKEKLK